MCNLTLLLQMRELKFTRLLYCSRHIYLILEFRKTSIFTNVRFIDLHVFEHLKTSSLISILWPHVVSGISLRFLIERKYAIFCLTWRRRNPVQIFEDLTRVCEWHLMYSYLILFFISVILLESIGKLATTLPARFVIAYVTDVFIVHG